MTYVEKYSGVKDDERDVGREGQRCLFPRERWSSRRGRLGGCGEMKGTGIQGKKEEEGEEKRSKHGAEAAARAGRGKVGLGKGKGEEIEERSRQRAK